MPDNPMPTRDNEPWADPSHPGNSPEHLSGKPCIESGCIKPAGTAWGPFWCQHHNAERIRRISKNMKEIANGFE